MRIKLFVIIVSSIISNALFAQESVIRDLDNQLLQKYITLAIKSYPTKKTYSARVERAKSTLTAAQMSWLDIINAGYYYRPETNTNNGTVGGTVTNNGQLITQGFLIGATVSVGSLLAKPSLIKAAKADYTAAQAENQQYIATLITTVKSSYYDYLLARKDLELRSLAAQNSKSILSDAKLRYQKAEIGIDTYTASNLAATQSEASAMVAEVTFLKAKNTLEDLIGVKLETVK